MTASRIATAGLVVGVVFAMATTSFGVLVVYYPLNETTNPSLTSLGGEAVADASGNNRNSTMVTDAPGVGTGAIVRVTSANEALYGTAYNFDSQETDKNYIQTPILGAPGFLTRDSALTYAAWIKPSDTQMAEAAVFGTNGNGYEFRLTPAGSDWALKLECINVPTSTLTSSVATIPSDEWSHVAITKDAFDTDADTAAVNFYVNGLLVESGTIGRTSSSPSGGQVRLMFFGASGIGPYYDGGLDEVRIYDEALSSAAVAAIAGLPIPGDYNHDGTVDSADYVVWRKDPTNPDYGGDPDGYDVWRSSFGLSNYGVATGTGSGLGTSVTVPEPSTIVLVGIGLIGLVGRRLRKPWM